MNYILVAEETDHRYRIGTRMFHLVPATLTFHASIVQPDQELSLILRDTRAITETREWTAVVTL